MLNQLRVHINNYHNQNGCNYTEMITTNFAMMRTKTFQYFT